MKAMHTEIRLLRSYFFDLKATLQLATRCRKNVED
jgi:hypothetical protein